MFPNKTLTLRPEAREECTRGNTRRNAGARLELVVAVEVVVAAEVAAAARRAARLLVDLRDDRRAGVLHLLELLVEVLLLGVLVVVEPLVDLLERLLDRLLVVVADLVGDALLAVAERVLHRVDVVLEGVTRLDLLADLLVLLLELLGLLHHPLDVLLREAALVLGDRALALEDLDVDRRLVVLVGREDLRLLRRDDRVARDELGHDAADRGALPS